MKEGLERRISLLQATAINMIDMVGIGPFVVMPLVISKFGDGRFLWAWIFGAFVALVDASIWSELGAKFPLAGGTYQFHRLAYGGRAGKLMSFLFVWQTSIQAPLVVASGAIGFAQYLTFLVPLEWWQQKMVSGGLVVLVFLLLYRKIETVGRISVALGAVVMLTILWIIVSGLLKGQQEVHLVAGSGLNMFDRAFAGALGFASVKTVYAYLGYYNVCHLGGEIRNPQKNIPRSIYISITGIALLYLLMNYSVASVIPYSSIRETDPYLVSSFMQQLYGRTAGIVVTILILLIAMASLFAVVLGYSRVPYAAAVDGNFFKVFAKLHPQKHFPHVSLTILCLAGFLFSLGMRLGDVITAILAMRIVVQFIAQAIGLMILRRREGGKTLPFRMWLYPVPVILSIAVWIFLLSATGMYALWGGLIALAGVGVFYLKK